MRWAMAAGGVGVVGAVLAARRVPAMDTDVTSRPVVLILALGALTLLPLVALMVTSFVKISVVLSIVRSALGTQQVPPTQVLTGFSIVLTLYAMAPVGSAMARAAGPEVLTAKQALLAPESVKQLLAAGERAREPLRDFLLKKATAKDRTLFFQLARRMRTGAEREAVTDRDFLVLVPAFVVSELKEAFQVGFILFLPFIVIDLVVANILLALGMHMLTPTTVSLPFKLLLFVLVDGWYLVSRGLLVGYA
jgi:type III secretion protein R